MILDALKNKEQYLSLHPRFKSVFDFIDTHDLAAAALSAFLPRWI